MLERLSKFLKPDHSAALGIWAKREGFAFDNIRNEDRLVWTGHLGAIGMRMESMPPRWDYLRGYELRLRLNLDLPDRLSLMVMSRGLKTRLEQQAYEGYTDKVRTTANLKLYEESRWLALFGELGWTTMAPDLWTRYAVLGDRREDAQAWLEGPLTAGLLSWDGSAVAAGSVPLVMMLTRGCLYVRTQHDRAEVQALSRLLDLARLAANRAQVFAGFGLSSLV